MSLEFVIQILDIIVPLVSVAILAVTLIFSLKARLRIQRVQAVSDFRNSYNHVRYELRQQVIDGTYDEEEFFIMFWSLQYDQFELWLGGFIPDHIYRYWMNVRYKEIKAKKFMFERLTYLEGWEIAKKYIDDPDFSDFMQLVLNGSIDKAFELVKSEKWKSIWKIFLNERKLKHNK